MTFETAMKHAMDEALFPHGFQRVKGRRPYYVRMIGDEIAQIMCYWKQLEFRPYVRFYIPWSVASVYRKTLGLTDGVRNRNWDEDVVTENKDNRVWFEYRDESRIIPGETYAIIGHNVSMEEEIEHAIGILKQIVLPKMDTMVTLKDCIENARSKTLYSEESVFGGNGDADNEGLINVKVYTFEEFRKSIEERTKNLSEGRLKDECMALAEAQIERFQRYTQESDLQKKIDEELERRKQYNQAMLRECGIKF